MLSSSLSSLDPVELGGEGDGFQDGRVQQTQPALPPSRQPSRAIAEMLQVWGLEGAALEEMGSCEHIFCWHN